MARPLLPDPSLRETRDEPSVARAAARAKWREKAKRRYWSSEEVRRAKVAAVEAWRERHPERAREVRNETAKRSRRGIQRAYRKGQNSA